MNPRALQKIGVAACLFALFCMLGGHWFALQSVAWARMAIRFSESASWSEALAKTFDGEHPCRMCNSIQEGRQRESAQEKQIPVTKREKTPDLWAGSRSFSVPAAPAAAEPAIPVVPRFDSDFIPTPPTPPPRAA